MINIYPQATKRRNPDFSLFLAAILLVGLGLIMIYSASAILAAEQYNDSYFFLKRQGIWALIGICAMVGVMSIEPQKYRKWVLPFLGISFLLLLLLFFIGSGSNGVERWFRFGSLSFQPSEMAKFAIILYLAEALSRENKVKEDWKKRILVPLIMLGGTFGLIASQPDYGTAVTIILIGFIIFFLADIKLRYLIFLMLLFLPVFVYIIYKVPYCWERIISFLHPGKDLQGSRYQVNQSLVAIGSGGFLGLGLGEGRQKLFYLPQAHNDFIFAIIGEEWGFIGTVGTIIIFLFLILRGIKTALSANTFFTTLLAAGITALFGIQAAINIGVVVGVLPTKGIPLPLVSSGGTSLFFNLVGIGMLLSISRGHSSRTLMDVRARKDSQEEVLQLRYPRRRKRIKKW